jgi:amino acid transporter
MKTDLQLDGETVSQGYSFGTFAGVFTPSILTIFGLIMFMRTSYVIGHSGIMMTLIMITVAHIITFSTGLSISVISTNTPVKGGGAYFLISRALGPGFGSSIGISLYLAQTLSVPFYILGFAEAVATNIPSLQPYFIFLTLVPAVLLFITSWIGADWAIKAQFFILAVLGVSIIVFLGGALFKPFSLEVFAQNWTPGKDFKFFHFFAIFFPAVTGIMAGVNMSGDLKDPQRSIPRGTLFAISVGCLVYTSQVLITGGAFAREDLIHNPYAILVENALFGAGFLVFAGVIAATISSALGSMLGAPRILQAIAKDKILKSFNFFAKGAGATNEPRRAMTLTFIVTIAVLIWSSLNESGPETDAGFDPLNIIAAIVTMFFLYTYAMVNLAAFVESFGGNPSFRPRFKYFHWSISLLGAISCIAASFMIDALASFVALIVMAVLFFITSKRDMQRTFGDARRGFVYSRIRDNLIKLAQMPPDPKNWRPTITVLSGNPENRTTLVKYANLFGDRRGILSIVKIVADETVSNDNIRTIRRREMEKLNEFADDNSFNFFPEVVVDKDFDCALRIFMQSHSIGPIKPNIIMTGWPRKEERIRPFVHLMNLIAKLEMNYVAMVDTRKSRVPLIPEGTIDIWWRGMSNGSLMVILAYLLTRNDNWKNVRIRLLRLAEKQERSQELEEMNKLVEAARIDAEVKVITSDKSFPEVFRYMSGNAVAIFMGTRIPDEEDYEEFFDQTAKLLDDMPVTFLVVSNGEANLMA